MVTQYLWDHALLLFYLGAGIGIFTIAIVGWLLNWWTKNRLIGTGIAVCAAFGFGVCAERLRHKLDGPDLGAGLTKGDSSYD